jgi:Icc-related predicted phosphoesterase
LTKGVAKTNPRLHVFGHVHGGYGREAGWNGICFVNCAMLNKAYVLTDELAVVELDR